VLSHSAFITHKDTAVNIKYKVILNETERADLEKLTSQGKNSARRIKRAQILLMSDSNANEDHEIAEILSVSPSTIYRVKRDFVEDGLEHALEESARSGQPRKLNANQEALLIAIACTNPPQGRCRWTLSLLGNQLVTLSDIETISHETIRQRLKDNDLKPWQKKMWCIANLDAAFIARMEHILDLYAEPKDEQRPIINFDEAGKQLIEEVNEPKSAKPGSVAKEDYEYQRAGMANIFMFFDRHGGWRKAKVTDQKTAVDFAECMKELVDKDYPDAEVVRVVLDNFSTHSEASLYKTFPAPEARRILQKLEFHFTPKHASWLNMAEIEIGNMNQQCLDRRIPNKQFLIEELEHWQTERNKEKASINWMFNVDKAREKLNRSYDKLIGQN
jgi:transposase